jgi:acyl carrier protein
MSLEQEIEEEIAIVLGDSRTETRDIASTARLAEDLGLDSMDMVEIAMALEERYGIEIPDEEGKALQTVADVMRCVQAKQTTGTPDREAGKKGSGA